MRSILFLLSLSFLIACGVPSNPNDPQPIDPYKLSCEEAEELFTSLAKQADKSCQKDSDCIHLGAWGDCDCFYIVHGGYFSKQNNPQLISLHERIFTSSLNCHQGREWRVCLRDYSKGPSLAYPICQDGQCSSQRTGEENICPGGSGEPWNP
jgi:hypothetical protein